MLVRFAALILALMMSLTAAQARLSSEPVYTPSRVVLTRMDGQPPTLEQMRKAILFGTQPFGWVLLQDQPGSLLIQYSKKDKHSATIRIEYDATSYQISYVSSKDLYYEPAQNGEPPMIHPTYNMWVRNLLARIMIPGELVPSSALSSSVKR